MRMSLDYDKSYNVRKNRTSAYIDYGENIFEAIKKFKTTILNQRNCDIKKPGENKDN
jgi:hypothetical protein